MGFSLYCFRLGDHRSKSHFQGFGGSTVLLASAPSSEGDDDDKIGSEPQDEHHKMIQKELILV